MTIKFLFILPTIRDTIEIFVTWFTMMGVLVFFSPSGKNEMHRGPSFCCVGACSSDLRIRRGLRPYLDD
ncbi:hypothetical protein GLYMA_18G193500v4 [Glycine max]|uniref:Uncharacterized protein n=1 Tax=Glycine max TaxID=3847 RepID=K7MTC6_SOYBN|nr:hypothetical protein GYH30_050486 [Glycine max]KRH00106.1 hypothetical protein GLYMA_18G193500v4 [Glycine max]